MLFNVLLLLMLLLMASRSRFQPTYDLMMMNKISKITAMMLLTVLLHVRKEVEEEEKATKKIKVVWFG